MRALRLCLAIALLSAPAIAQDSMPPIYTFDAGSQSGFAMPSPQLTIAAAHSKTIITVSEDMLTVTFDWPAVESCVSDPGLGYLLRNFCAVAVAARKEGAER